MQSKRRSAQHAAAQPSTRADESAFIQRLAEGDTAAYRELLETYWRPLVAYTARILESQDAAEDAVQQVFIRLWQCRKTFQSTRNLSPYLYKAVRNVAHAELRKLRGRQATTPPVRIAPLPSTPLELTELSELEATAEQAIEALPARRREVFLLAHVHQLAHQEIAEALELKLQTVSNHMNLALRDLRHALQPYVDQKLRPRRP